MAKDKKLPIINAHTHIFTGNFVPPFLARSIVPWPFFYIFHTGWLIGLVKRYYKNKFKKEFGNSKDKKEQARLWNKIYSKRRGKRTKMLRSYGITSRWYFNVPLTALGLWLSVVAAIYLMDFITILFGVESFDWLERVKDWMGKYYLYYDDLYVWLKAFWLIAVLYFIKSSRRILLQVSKSMLPFLKKIFSKQVIDLANRYWLLGRFSFYETQRKVAFRVIHQLPKGSSIVVLPMDMEYMGAGKSKLTKKILKSKAEKLKKGWEEKDFEDSFKYQMRELWDLVKNSKNSGPKSIYYPFLFVDPRRIREERELEEKNKRLETEKFFEYDLIPLDEHGTVCNHGNDCTDCKHSRMELKPCYVKTYMEDRRFSGFKIYPALGYYPFDEDLLPIWRYAAENDIPIMTHCVKGVVYFRGAKQPDWNFHPVFKMKYFSDDKKVDDVEVIEELDEIDENHEEHESYDKMMLPETKPIDFQINFTHPLNYLCLVEEKFLKMLLAETDEKSKVRAVFGFDDTNNTLLYNLKNLKICLAHYGGEDEWTRYMEQDRNNYSQRLMRDPKVGIKFMENSKKKFSWFKINDLWHETDWYSLISSMLIEYDNIYADLSYIISKPSIFPLLRYSLEKGENYETEHAEYLKESDLNKKAVHYSGKNKLRSRILFGTDFYVVRNHKSDKDMFVETKALLGDEDFDLIARENTHNYLSRSYNKYS